MTMKQEGTLLAHHPVRDEYHPQRVRESRTFRYDNHQRETPRPLVQTSGASSTVFLRVYDR